MSQSATYDLFSSPLDISSAKAKLNEKQFAPVIALRLDTSNMPYSFVMTASALLDFIFAVQFGVNINIDSLTWEQLQNLLKNLINTQTISITQIVNPQYSNAFSQTLISKCVYGKSLFDYCYYDPVFTLDNVKSWLRSAINRSSRNVATQPTLSAVNVNPNLAQWFNSLLNAVLQALQNACYLDACLLDVSQFAPEQADVSILLYIYRTLLEELNGKQLDIQTTTLDDALWGCILDFSPLDVCRLTPVDVTIMVPDFWRYVSTIWLAVKSNFSPMQTASKSAFVDPTLPSISIPPTLAELFQEAFPQLAENAPFAPLTAPAERWGSQISLMYNVRSAVRRMLRSKPIPAPMLNAYANAAVEYCMAFHHRRDRLRYRVYAGVGLSNFESLWLSKWTSFGLDQATLQQMLPTLRTVCAVPGGRDSPLP